MGVFIDIIGHGRIGNKEITKSGKAHGHMQYKLRRIQHTRMDNVGSCFTNLQFEKSVYVIKDCMNR